jgi:hypothetical protein
MSDQKRTKAADYVVGYRRPRKPRNSSLEKAAIREGAQRVADPSGLSCRT